MFSWKWKSLTWAQGVLTTIFKAEQNGYIDSVVVSPDHTQIVMAYSPPSLQEGTYFLSLTLYSMPIDGSSLPSSCFPYP